MPERSDMALRFNNDVHRQKLPQEPKIKYKYGTFLF